MSENQSGIKRIWHRITGDERSTLKAPVLNTVIMVYIGLTLLCYVLFLIAPFVTFISQTPLRHIQSYLGILGGLLLCADLFTNKVVWRTPYCMLLYALCALAGISALMTISYGVEDNLFLICWTLIEFSLFYSCAYRWEQTRLRKFMKYLYATILLCWFVACCVSVYQYVFQIGYRYVINPLSDDNSLARQGFLEGRLFGIFSPLNHAVYVSLMLMIIGVYYFLQSKRPLIKVALLIANLPLFFHIILSGSRSAQVSMLVCSFAVLWLWFRNRSRYTDFRRFILPLGLALLLTVVLALGFMGVKTVLGEVPHWVGSVPTSVKPEDPLLPSGDNEPLPEEDVLHREGLEENVSNDRFKIWTDYLSLYREIGLFGLSPGNYMSYVRENHPDMFIVQYVRDNYPGKFMHGTIYHVHNGYLMVFVSTGFAGVLLMLAFIVLCLVRLVRYMKRLARVSDAFIFAFAVATAGAISAVFDKGVFFMNNPSSFLFWMALGFLMSQSQMKEQR